MTKFAFPVKKDSGYPSGISDRRAVFFVRFGVVLPAAFAGIYAAYFSCLSYLKYTSFAYNDFDLAIHAQTLWNILRGSLDLSVLGVPFLGNHAHFIHFLLAPIYFFFPHPLFLLVVQSLFLGLGAVPLYLIGRSSGIPGGGLLLSVVYLFYPALGNMNLYEFHPTALSTLFLIWTCWAFQTRRFVQFWVWSSLAMFCQENLPLVVFMFGPMAWLRGMGRKWILSPMIVGGTVFFFLTGWLLPYLNRGLVGFESLYSHLGKGTFQILTTIVFRPFYVLGILLRPQNFNFLAALFLPVAFLSFIRPFWLIPTIPLFLQHLLSLRATERTILYHYQAELIPFIFVSALMGWRYLACHRRLRGHSPVLGILMAAWTLAVNLCMGPHFKVLGQIANWLPDELDGVRTRWTLQIPQDASVMSTFEFLPHLANRRHLYSFHHLYSGRYTLSIKEYKPPPGVRFLLLDTMDPLTYTAFLNGEGDERLRSYLKDGNWGLMEAHDNLLFYEQGKPSKLSLWRVFPKDVQQTPLAVFSEGLLWYGSDISSETADAGGVLKLRWRWGAARPLNRIYGCKLEIRDAKGALAFDRRHVLGYHIFPSDEWSVHEIFEEDYHLTLPRSLAEGHYTIHCFVIDGAKRTLSKAAARGADAAYVDNGLLLGRFRIG